MTVELVPIVEDNVGDVCDLAMLEIDPVEPTGELDDDEVVARLDLTALSTADANGALP